jgi:Holliday junction DNA helicase RuvA
MLEHVRGRLVRTDTGSIIVEAGGLGFLIRVADGDAFHANRTGEITVPVVMETGGDEPVLVGFPSEGERKAYRELRRIPGIGPATALRLIPELDGLRAGRTAILDGMKGLGPKRRERILKWLKRPFGEAATGSETSRSLRAALAALGMGPAEARTRAVRALRKNPGAGLEELVRLAVKG